jgi:hypothetical protein
LPKKYARQRGKKFATRYKGHIHSTTNNSTNSNQAQHTLKTNHTHSTTETTKDILHTTDNEKHINITGKFCIFKLSTETKTPKTTTHHPQKSDSMYNSHTKPKNKHKHRKPLPEHATQLSTHTTSPISAN